MCYWAPIVSKNSIISFVHIHAQAFRSFHFVLSMFNKRLRFFSSRFFNIGSSEYCVYWKSNHFHSVSRKIESTTTTRQPELICIRKINLLVSMFEICWCSIYFHGAETNSLPVPYFSIHFDTSIFFFRCRFSTFWKFIFQIEVFLFSFDSCRHSKLRIKISDSENCCWVFPMTFQQLSNSWFNCHNSN